MKVTVLNKQIQVTPADALIINLFEGVQIPGGATGAVDTALGASDGVPGDGAISQLLKLGDFKGKLNEVTVVYTHGLIPAPRVIVVGLGKTGDFSAERAMQASGVAARKARDLGCKTIATLAHGAGVGGLNTHAAARATIEGALMGTYQFREHKAKPTGGKVLDEIILVEYDAKKLDEINAGVREGEAIANAVNTARTLMNRAPNVLNPVAMADFASAMAAQLGLTCTVMGEDEIKANKMGGIIAVAQGSANAPRFVVLEHKPDTSNVKRQTLSVNGSMTQSPTAQFDKPLVFIGKGVTFDTGGISLKDPGGMEAMKGDMGGAAAVIGAMQAVAALNLPRHVIGLIPMVENMPSDRAFRPGDVITMMSGLTVEILSTDAEGRMILADALHWAKRYDPAGVVDLATLTGACVIALGEGVAAGLFANNDDWAKQVLSAAGSAGERLWQLPLYAEYGEKIRGDFAEIKNTGGRFGGVGTSAYFLKRFAETDKGNDAYPWAHIDMAGMTFCNENKGHQVKGAMGYGVRMLVELARSA